MALLDLFIPNLPRVYQAPETLCTPADTKTFTPRNDFINLKFPENECSSEQTVLVGYRGQSRTP